MTMSPAVQAIFQQAMLLPLEPQLQLADKLRIAMMNSGDTPIDEPYLKELEDRSTEYYANIAKPRT
jgi:hypothetical protein